MPKNLSFFIKIFLCLLLLTSGILGKAAATDQVTMGYQLAVLEEQALNPENVLLRKKIIPDNATIREFEWILETLRNKCNNPDDELVGILVKTWRSVQQRGYHLTLLQYSRELASFSNIAYQSYKNQKVDFQKVAFKWIKEKYPVKP